MSRLEILHGLEILIFKHPRKKWHFDLLEKLRENEYVDWFGWYDKKLGRYKHAINTTHKGLLYYAEHRNKKYNKVGIMLLIILLLSPIFAFFVFLW
jgi:hypothetical protein